MKEHKKNFQDKITLLLNNNIRLEDTIQNNNKK